MTTDLTVPGDSSPAPYNPPCETCGTTLVSTTDLDFFGPGYHYYSLRCPTCRPIAEVQNR
jgi:hypothetical protein